MFDRFTGGARKVAQLARQEAQHLKQEFIGTEHFLLALVSEGSAFPSTLLARRNLTLEQIRLGVLQRVVWTLMPHAPPGHLPFTPAAKKALELSLEESQSLGHNYIGPTHLLLGVLGEHDSVAAQVLLGLGITAADVRTEAFAAPAARSPSSVSRSRYPARATIVEVSPRDGLQNEATFVPTATKLELIRLLEAAGVTEIEATSFVSPKWVPQLADAGEVMAGLVANPGARYSVLVPNLQGYERAVAAGAQRIAVFTAASETFSKTNTNATIAETLERFAPVLARATAAGHWVRGYVSCALGCPYEGHVDPARVLEVACALADAGCDEIAIADTIGVGTPREVEALLGLLTERIDPLRLAVHFHDTYGQALANIHAALRMGVIRIDASVAGLGGCPYAKGASGNVATEDVVYSLARSGVDTGLDQDRLMGAGRFACAALGRPNGSRVATARGASGNS